jgi:hypothetical protein
MLKGINLAAAFFAISNSSVQREKREKKRARENFCLQVCGLLLERAIKATTASAPDNLKPL